MADQLPSSESNRADEPRFEESVSELQQIVAQLESGALTLEESMARFERGVGLLRRCQQMLDAAEQRIEILTGFDAAGQPVTAPFNAESTLDAQTSAKLAPAGLATSQPVTAEPSTSRDPGPAAPETSEESEPPAGETKAPKARRTRTPRASLLDDDDLPF